MSMNQRKACLDMNRTRQLLWQTWPMDQQECSSPRLVWAKPSHEGIPILRAGNHDCYESSIGPDGKQGQRNLWAKGCIDKLPC
eukprot:1299925-Prorocentrum_lima.AAC.2